MAIKNYSNIYASPYSYALAVFAFVEMPPYLLIMIFI